MSRQFLACRFGSTGRTYTYHWDDAPPLSIGESVKVEARGGGLAFVEVVSIEPQPAFSTKPILGRAEPKAGRLL